MKIIKRIFKTILLLSLILIIFTVYSFYIEPNLLSVKEYSIDGEDRVNLKIAHISDIHIKEDFKEDRLDKIVKKINEARPDIVVFTGDLFDNYKKYGDMDLTIEKLSKIESNYGNFAVWGNHDYGGGGYKVYEEILYKAGFRLLKNDRTSINTDDGKSIEIIGLDDGLLGNPDLSLINKNEEKDYRIILTHESDHIKPRENIDLILSGHSHGGQVNIPFVNKILPELGEKYIGGSYKLGTTNLFVNTGIGTTRLSIRFRVVPEISILNIY